MGFKDNDLDEESQAFYGDDGNDDEFDESVCSQTSYGHGKC